MFIYTYIYIYIYTFSEPRVQDAASRTSPPYVPLRALSPCLDVSLALSLSLSLVVLGSVRCAASSRAVEAAPPRLAVCVDDSVLLLAPARASRPQIAP